MSNCLKSLLIFLAILYPISDAQAQYFGGYGRNTQFMSLDPEKSKYYEFHIVSSFTAPYCEVEYYQSENGKIVMKKASAKAKQNYHLGIGTGGSFRLAKLSDKSTLSFNLGGIVSMAKAHISNKELNIKEATDFTQELDYLKLTFPFGLDYKSGAEAAADKTLKSMFTMGAGIALIGGIDGIGGSGGNVYVSPFAKVEVGYFLGIAFKIRATYSFGEQLWYESTFGNNNFIMNLPPQNPHINYKLSTDGDLLISLIIMPFSYTWEEY